MVGQLIQNLVWIFPNGSTANTKPCLDTSKWWINGPSKTILMNLNDSTACSNTAGRKDRLPMHYHRQASMHVNRQLLLGAPCRNEPIRMFVFRFTQTHGPSWNIIRSQTLDLSLSFWLIFQYIWHLMSTVWKRNQGGHIWMGIQILRLVFSTG